MNFLKSLFSSSIKNKSFKSIKRFDVSCPNCWGREEYGGNFYKAVKNQVLNINKMDNRAGWIQDYANKYLLGLKLKKTSEGYICPSCKLTYNEDS